MLRFTPPEIIKTEVHFRLPDKMRAKKRYEWSDPNRLGAAVDSFLEAPAFDRQGNLWFVDIPCGRVFRLTPKGECDVAAQFDGWPNGLKFHKDGRAFICDYKIGLLVLDPKTGRTEPVLRTRNSESFKGLNDLHFASNGDLYFTDQGQTGMHDPTGRVYRLRPSGQLDLLMWTIPSPNGITLDPAERRIYVAVTRQNAVWRCPIMEDGSVSKVGTYIQMSGGHAGPDGIALDEEGGLLVCHLGTGIWRFDSHGQATHVVEACVGAHMTNVAFGGPDNRDLYITEADTGSILKARMPVPGKRLYGLM